MADALDIEAKRRGISRETLVAYYMKLHSMTGQNGTGTPTANQQRIQTPQPKAPVDNRNAFQRIMDALGGNPNGN
jgi:hypothetical protein